MKVCKPQKRSKGNVIVTGFLCAVLGTRALPENRMNAKASERALFISEIQRK